MFWVAGGDVGLFQPFAIVDKIHADHRWTLDELQAEAAPLRRLRVRAQPSLVGDAAESCSGRVVIGVAPASAPPSTTSV